MTSFARRVLDSLAPALALAIGLALAGNAAAAGPAPSPLKLRQQRLMLQEPMRERRERLERVRELRRLANRLKAGGHASLRVRGDRARPEGRDEDARRLGPAALASRAAASPAAARATAALATNVRCNDPSGDLLSAGFGSTVVEGQCETAIARWNNDLVAAWNDGKGFDDGTGQTQGWATSTDGGVTWIDHGTFPLPAAYTGWTWTSDPVLSVNPTTGAFYFSALGEVTGSFSAACVVKGRFTGTTFAWGSPSVGRSVAYSTNFIDKEWVAVDPADGRVYLTYTDFTSTGNQIEFQWADSTLGSWSAYQVISAVTENGWVQASRPAVGPDGTVYVVYYLIGPVDADYYRIARSTNRGASFSAPNDAMSFYSNYGTGAPGFNRPQGMQFPSLAVDRSGRQHNGRLYLAWNESLDWYDDAANVGNAGSKNEVEPDDTPATATATAVGRILRGTMATTSDLDYFALPLTAGQTIIAEVDSMATGLDVTMRLFAPDGTTRLAYLDAAATDLAAGYGPLPWLYTAPTAGTYYLRVADVSGTGAYRLSTGPAYRTIERGRDQRDAFTAWSDDGGLTWSTPVRVNNDAVGYDDWLPEVTVGPTGQVVCAWYDWRNAAAATCGGESSIYLATSNDGAATWQEQGSVTDTRTAWSNVLSNIVPNQGDYISLVADGHGYAVAWSDGRSGNPDVYMAAVPPLTTGVADAAPAPLRLVTDAAPAIGSAHLTFALAEAGPARLDVYDLEGRRVATLVDGARPAGEQSADWNLADAAGRPVGAGVYWARLEAGAARATARMVVLR